MLFIFLKTNYIYSNRENLLSEVRTVRTISKLLHNTVTFPEQKYVLRLKLTCIKVVIYEVCRLKMVSLVIPKGYLRIKYAPTSLIPMHSVRTKTQWKYVVKLDLFRSDMQSPVLLLS